MAVYNIHGGHNPSGKIACGASDLLDESKEDRKIAKAIIKYLKKAAMLFSVCLLMSIDVIMNVNVLSFVPEQYVQILGINKMGICEFFSLLFILYEAVSILKNMTLCGLPVPTRIKNFIQKFLEDMTEELPDQEGETNHEI